MTVLTVTIPGVPPSTNHMYGRGRGRVYQAAGVTSYQADVIAIVRNAAALQAPLLSGWRLSVDTGSIVRVELTWYRPDRRRRDSSNIVKTLEDALATALEINDEWFEWTTRRGYDPKNPRVELTLSLEGATDDGS